MAPVGAAGLDRLDVLCFWAFATLAEVVFDGLAFGESLEAVGLNCAVVDEDIGASGLIWRYKAVALLRVEELNGSCSHFISYSLLTVSNDAPKGTTTKPVQP
jgi:hypothetical protein